MKKYLFLGLMLLVGTSHAAYLETYSLGQASFTLTNDSAVQISTHGGILVGVIIDSQSAGGTLTLADAWVSVKAPNAPTYSTFSILSLGAGNAPTSLPTYISYNVLLSSGLTYTTAGNTGGVTIIWRSLLSPTSGK